LKEETQISQSLLCFPEAHTVETDAATKAYCVVSAALTYSSID
jgi:hypothetical protein